MRKVGDGVDTLFSHGRWLGGIPFCVRLFDSAENKSSSVATMFSLGWEEGGEAWKWLRRLRTWEEDLLVECRTLFHDVYLQTNLSDKWQ